MIHTNEFQPDIPIQNTWRWSDMHNMSNELLIEAYFKALDFNLDHEFIKQLETEIRRRALLNKLKKSS